MGDLIMITDSPNAELVAVCEKWACRVGHEFKDADKLLQASHRLREAADLQARLDAMTTERDAARAEAADMREKSIANARERNAAERRLADAVEALTPFKWAADCLNKSDANSTFVEDTPARLSINAGHLRRAAAIVKEGV